VPTTTTAAEAAARARLITVESYAVFLDLTAPGETARSRTEIVFTCHELGATTFADLDPVLLHSAVLNGEPLDPAAVSDGRLRLAHLAARNFLTLDATVAITTSGQGLTCYTDPSDGQRYVLASCYPTAAPRIFCCFDQPDLRASLNLIVTLPAGWACVANGELLHRPDEAAAGVWRFATVSDLTPFDFTFAAGPYVAVDRTSVPGETVEPAGGDPRRRWRSTVAPCWPMLRGWPGSPSSSRRRCGTTSNC
jgi:aminopeptidase N